ncbi:unnamed protein product [Mytilus edulis]|uniref:Uncharacterized protein n=1 Tax=Mytilus edulis TaxID=6550 RepID=A0A8S3PWM4_MYTED|nr:unnamed protein product [Mytilus edulis]
MNGDKSVNNEPDLIYTELQPCSLQCSQNTYIQNNFDTEITSNNSQDIVRQFLGSQSEHMANPFDYTLSTNMSNQDPDPKKLVLQSIEDQCNGLPKDTFVTRLVQFCDNDAIALEQLRLQYFVMAKQRLDFPFASAILKKRMQPKTKKGEPLVNKLGRDCFSLRLATKGEFCDDLKEALSIKPSLRDTPCVNDLVTSTPQLYVDSSIRDTLIHVESSIIELKIAHENDKSALLCKIDSLQKQNVKLNDDFTKQKERMNNIQNQLNLARTANNKLNDNLACVKSELKSVSLKQVDLANDNSNTTETMRSANNKIKEIELVIENNKTTVSKCEARISKVSVVANETKTRLNSEASRITNISDIRSTGICSVKSKVLLLSDQVKDVNIALEDFQTKINSSMTSTSELRRRVVNVEKNVQASKREVTTYAAAAVQTADKSVSVVPLDSPIRSETPRTSTSCPTLPAHDRIHVSQETISKTDNQIRNMSTSSKTTNIQANDTNSISVHFPRSVCNPKTSDFKGFTRKSRRVSRFYIGGIDKSCSSEDNMRYFLSERNIRVTFLRYFNRPSKRTAAAQLNIVADDEHLITHPEFWPQGIYMKQWLPWEQFASEHSITPS